MLVLVHLRKLWTNHLTVALVEDPVVTWPHSVRTTGGHLMTIWPLHDSLWPVLGSLCVKCSTGHKVNPYLAPPLRSCLRTQLKNPPLCTHFGPISHHQTIQKIYNPFQPWNVHQFWIKPLKNNRCAPLCVISSEPNKIISTVVFSEGNNPETCFHYLGS